MYAVIIIVLMFLGSVIVWAEDDEPTDRLYEPIKIGITERAGQTLGQFSKKIDIEWEIQLAERRLREVQGLILEDKLAPVLLADLRERFAAHAGRVETLLREEEETGDPLRAAEFALFSEARMSAFEEVFVVLAPQLDDQPQKQILALIEDIQTKREKLTAIRDRVEGNIAVYKNIERAAKNRARGSRTETDISERRFDQRRMRLSESEQAYLQTELDAALAVISEGRTFLENEEWADAFLAFQEADRYAQRIEILADAARVIEFR